MPFDQTNYQPTDPVLKCLQDARQWLSNPAHWIKGSHFSDDCSAACARGAVLKFAGYLGRSKSFCGFTPEESAPLNLLDRVAFDSSGVGSMGLNDHSSTTHADVLALFDLTIERRLSELLASQSQVGS